MTAQRLAFALCVLLLGAGIQLQPAQAQTTDFGGIRADTSAAVEISADSLTIDQADGSAVFSGNVVVSQGAMRLAAALVRVEYGNDGQREISRLLASGGVVLASGSDAAEAESAEYTILSGTVVLSGNVVLTQGGNVLSGQRLTVNLTTGTATVEGRVQTTLQPGGN
ncbi:MAG: LptA/OstA family protein [Phaeovulum sp.]|uniref:LptA/OstA family protein n=1 Tax=Phaeovulum sp. TaxID=2934796 RepID=UPI00273056DA|nr:LptA/OstA family protein [Phaeovulum sp.]MDP2061815.1 LptA/OstA family protein [Phaeovulum sp.]